MWPLQPLFASKPAPVQPWLESSLGIALGYNERLSRTRVRLEQSKPNSLSQQFQE